MILTNDNILIKVEEIDEINGIVLPVSNNINEKAKVLKVGDKVDKIKKGDTVYFKSWAIDKVNIYHPERKEYAFIKEEFILAYERK